MNRARIYKILIPAGIALLGISLAFAPLLFFSDRALLFRDHSLLFMPGKFLWLKSILEEGKIARWNFFFVGGMPFYSDISIGPLWPLNWILLPLSSLEFPRAYSYFVVCHYFFLYLAGYFLLRVWLPALGISLALALSLAIGGGPVGNSSSIMLVGGLIGVYLGLGAWLRFLRKSHWLWFSLTAVGLALPFYSGEPQQAYVTGFLLLAFTLASRRRALADFASLALVSVTAILLAAPQVFPALELIASSQRGLGNLSPDDALGWSLHPARWLDFFFPMPFGNFEPQYTYWAAEWLDSLPIGTYPFVFSFYIGVLGVWGLLFYWVSQWHLVLRRKNWRALFPFALMAVFFVLAIGRFSPLPLYFWFWKLVPFWSSFRFPERLVHFEIILFLAFAAIGWRRFLLIAKLWKNFSRPDRRPMPRIFWIVPACLVGICLLACAEALYYSKQISWGISIGLLTQVLFLMVLVACVWLPNFRPKWNLLLLGVALFDLGFAMQDLVWDTSISISRASSYSEVEKWQKSMDTRSEELSKGGARRVFMDKSEAQNPQFLNRGAIILSQIAAVNLYQWSHLESNIGVNFGMEVVGPYHTLIGSRVLNLMDSGLDPRRIQDLFAAYYVRADLTEKQAPEIAENRSALPYAFLTENFFSIESYKLMRVLGHPDFIRDRWAVITNAEKAVGDISALGKGRRGMPASIPAPELRLLSRKSDRVQFSVRAAAEYPRSFLVWNEGFSEHWRASLAKTDGKAFAERILLTNGWAMGIPLPAMQAGEEISISMQYEDPMIFWGGAAFLLGCSVLLGFLYRTTGSNFVRGKTWGKS